MIDSTPMRLKPEDSAPPAPDLQATLIELSDAADDLTGELERLRDLLARWGTDPTGVCRRAQPRTVELHDQAGRLRDLVQRVAQGQRAAGLLSMPYGRVGGA